MLSRWRRLSASPPATSTDAAALWGPQAQSQVYGGVTYYNTVQQQVQPKPSPPRRTSQPVTIKPPPPEVPSPRRESVRVWCRTAGARATLPSPSPSQKIRCSKEIVSCLTFDMSQSSGSRCGW